MINQAMDFAIRYRTHNIDQHAALLRFYGLERGGCSVRLQVLDFGDIHMSDKAHPAMHTARVDSRTAPLEFLGTFACVDLQNLAYNTMQVVQFPFKYQPKSFMRNEDKSLGELAVSQSVTLIHHVKPLERLGKLRSFRSLQDFSRFDLA